VAEVSKKPRKMVTMSKDMFSILLTWAFFMGWFIPDVYTYLVITYG
jgi:hypothetical protein